HPLVIGSKAERPLHAWVTFLLGTAVERAVGMSRKHLAEQMLRDPVAQATHWRLTPATAQPIPTPPVPALTPARATPVTRDDCWALQIPVKFNGDLARLSAFSIHVWLFMARHASLLSNNEAMVYCVVRALEGEAADWAVTLYAEGPPELRHYEAFMAALRQHFRDPLADRKAKIKLQTINVSGGNQPPSATPRHPRGPQS
uniref:DUF4939 domain-containing protein n=1 Tax=Laticauda laticaudata TaxID=8630 RepID=A0A8C5SPH8_LATLA